VIKMSPEMVHSLHGSEDCSMQRILWQRRNRLKKLAPEINPLSQWWNS